MIIPHTIVIPTKSIIVASLVALRLFYSYIYRCVKVMSWLHYDSVTTVYGYVFGCVMTMLQLCLQLWAIMHVSAEYLHLLQLCYTIVFCYYDFTVTLWLFLQLWLLVLLWLCYSIVYGFVKLMIVVLRLFHSYVMTQTAMLQKCLWLCYNFQRLVFIAMLHQRYNKLTADLLVFPQQILFTRCHCIASKC